VRPGRDCDRGLTGSTTTIRFMSHGSGGPLPDGRVALLFTDVQGSTALLHQLGDAYGDVLDEHDRILRGVWDQFDGVEVDNEGDAFFVAFADHAQAIEAVTAAQQRLATAAWPDGVQVKVRMALHSGEPAVRGRKYWGVDVHYAARLGSAAHGGQVLLSADMRARVPHARVELLGMHGLKDFPAARPLFHLVVGSGSAADFPPPRTLAAARSNLPTIDTPIVGREAVLTDLRARLTGNSHLVTLIGPGGMGKTRTAIAAGEDLARDFPDGVAFVTMASLQDAAEVPGAIAEALQEDFQGTDAAAALESLLRERRLLIILDNAEHLPGLANVLAPLVEAARDSHWLVTSQEPLGIRAETQVRLGSLGAAAAAELFVERARARQPGFTVATEDQQLLADLCHELDGIPLALELAAARAPVLGLARLVQALGADPDRALGHGAPDLPERQRGLQAALDWTVSLLNETEHLAYACCGAFAEAWSIDGLEYMLDGRTEVDQVWDALARLLDLSLVVQRGDGRFTMPERVRRHATAFLEATDLDHSIRRRHADFVLATLAQFVQTERHIRFLSAMAAVEDGLPEVQHALSWASAHDSDTYRMLLGSSLWSLGWFDKHWPWLEDVIRFARAEDPGDLAQGRVWCFACTGMSGVDDLAERRTWLDAALNRFLELEDHAWVCEMYVTLFEFECAAGNVATGLQALHAGHDYAVSQGLEDYARLFEDNVAIALIASGDFEEAERRIRPWLDDESVVNWARAGVATFLGDCAMGRGAYRDAAGWYAEDMRRLPRSHVGNMLMQVAGIAASCAELGLDSPAVELNVACAKVMTELHVAVVSSLSTGSEHAAAAMLRLPPDELEAARSRGEQLDYDALVERTLEIAAEVTG
jgi:predicted ATPase/class 3 adenylate cyclase